SNSSAPVGMGQVRAVFSVHFTLHEPQGRAGVSPASVGNADGTESLALARWLGRRDACPTLGAFHGSWSTCMRQSEWRHSMNRPTRRSFLVCWPVVCLRCWLGAAI